MSEENQKKETVTGEGGEEIFEEYLKPRRYKPRFWVWVTLTISAIILVIIYKITVIDTAINPEALKPSIEMFNLDSQWVVLEKIDTKEFKGIVLVPQISFQVRNVGNVILRNVFFLGEFRLLDRAKNLGDGSHMAFKKPVNPGEESERIVLTCGAGYRASSKMAFKNNIKEWKRAMVEIYVKTGSSKLTFLKIFYITRKIEGLDVDIQLTDKTADELIGEQEEQK
jgi:hypothetical protein